MNYHDLLPERERLAIWINCYKHFSVPMLLERLKDIKDGLVSDSEKGAELRVLAIKSVIQYKTGHACN